MTSAALSPRTRSASVSSARVEKGGSQHQVEGRGRFRQCKSKGISGAVHTHKVGSRAWRGNAKQLEQRVKCYRGEKLGHDMRDCPSAADEGSGWGATPAGKRRPFFAQVPPTSFLATMTLAEQLAGRTSGTYPLVLTSTTGAALVVPGAHVRC